MCGNFSGRCDWGGQLKQFLCSSWGHFALFYCILYRQPITTSTILNLCNKIQHSMVNKYYFYSYFVITARGHDWDCRAIAIHPTECQLLVLVPLWLSLLYPGKHSFWIKSLKILNTDNFTDIPMLWLMQLSIRQNIDHSYGTNLSTFSINDALPESLQNGEWTSCDISQSRVFIQLFRDLMAHKVTFYCIFQLNKNNKIICSL